MSASSLPPRLTDKQLDVMLETLRHPSTEQEYGRMQLYEDRIEILVREVRRLRERETALTEERGLFEATAAVAEAKVRELTVRETALAAKLEEMRGAAIAVVQVAANHGTGTVALSKQVQYLAKVLNDEPA